MSVGEHVPDLPHFLVRTPALFLTPEGSSKELRLALGWDASDPMYPTRRKYS